ncbi:Phototropin-2 [Dactylella cylindrospora]|nr:Phototropin-2 [Dactylella cylindrospora]
MDPNNLDSLYGFIPQNLQGRMVPTSDSIPDTLRHASIASSTMEGLTGPIGPVLDDTMDATVGLMSADVDDAMMEEMQELRRQSMTGFPMGFINYTGLTDAQQGLDLGLQPLTTTGLPFGNTFDSPMFISPQTTTAAGGLLDITGYTDGFIPQLQPFGSTISPQITSRQNSLIDAMDTTGALPLPQQTAAVPLDDAQQVIPAPTRANPKINIGAVDMSCAFVVCDARKYDMPIVYCSATFERLTGYTKHEILGRNCRFLQSPTGQVEKGSKRKYVDEESVRYLKQQCDDLDEAQVSLINYRKGGQPFMNLLTTIPITWDGDDIVYIVGTTSCSDYSSDINDYFNLEND